MSRKAYARDDVIATAMDVFWDKGYHGTSVQDLCDATGLNKKSLYAEFETKGSLFEEAVGRYTGGARIESAGALGAEPLGLANIERYFGGMAYEDECRGCLMTMTINERALVPEAAVDTVRATLREIERLLLANLRAAGIGRAKAERLATFLVFSIQGITTMGKLSGDNRMLAHTVRTILEVVRTAVPRSPARARR